VLETDPKPFALQLSRKEKRIERVKGSNDKVRYLLDSIEETEIFFPPALLLFRRLLAFEERK
jgi:hypothetical protein